MSSEPAASGTRPNPLVRLFLVGLPAGLFLLGAFSFVIYFQKRQAREASTVAPSKYAAMLRKDVNLEDYRRYVRTFEEVIGPRTADQPDNLEAARSFIESTLGFGNMGYQILRREEDGPGGPRIHFEAEVPGSASGPICLVTARYDGSAARDIAALLCLANAFTGTSHAGSIRFVAWSAGTLPDEKFPLERYRQWLPGETSGAPGVLEVHGPDAASSEAAGRLQELVREVNDRASGKAGR